MNIIKRKPINLTSPVLFFAAAQNDGIRNFDINAYTGAVINTWYGKLVFEISGISAKPKIPVLREHYRDRIVGFGKGSQYGQVFSVSGTFTNATRDGRECLALADEGYPWQASIGIRPVKVKTIGEKEECQVNGKTLKGPAEVWLKSEVGEVSFVSQGADSATSISVFSESDVEIEAELETRNLETLSITPGAVDIPTGPNNKPLSTGKKENGMRLFEKLLAKNLSSGLPLLSALQKTIDTAPELHQDMICRATAGEKIYFDLADQSQFFDFTSAVQTTSKRENLSLAASVRKCAEIYPALHLRYVEGLKEEAKNARKRR